ncbi:DUF4405 domain-containing protein [uncultured Cohaesibacter sp.]|uniref:DUF4405 domain-containing protein n=1 Tax=uncultured Cohaesibacter sp. TaxID=1002546 RepID=UPI0029C70BFE|nr:DUF4405 domain-containing protein [uncultured Cohaesibacter sp.]
MNRQLLLRLGLDCIATGLFIFALAYDWLGGLIHEVIGTAFFALLIAHTVFNRRWYASLAKAMQNRRRLITTIINLSLLLAALALLVTSLMISRALFGFLGLQGDYLARQTHTLSAYWMLVIVGIHLGMHWSMIMSAVRSLLRFQGPGWLRIWGLRALTLLLVINGIAASFEMNIGSKLILYFTFSYWDFENEALGFLINYGSIIALYAALAHYGAKRLQGKRERRSSGSVRPSA